MYCKNCGKEISEQSVFCPSCGASREGATSTGTHTAQASAGEPYTTPPTAPRYGYPPNNRKVPFCGMAVAGFVLGCVSLLLNLFGIVGLLALIFSIVGIVKTGQRQKRGRGLAIAGTVLGAIGIIYGVFATINMIVLL